MLFLQITTLPAEPIQTTPQDSINLLDLVLKGGIIMVPILLLSILAVYVLVERTLVLSRALKNTSGLLSALRTAILNADLASAKSTVAQYDYPVARMLARGVKRIGSPIKEIEAAMESVGKVELMKLEKNLSLLGIVAAVAPMMGFVGTIAGVIQIFYNISLEDNISIGNIAEGLYVKMITSAAGLIIGIIAHIGYQLLMMRIEKITLSMEEAGAEFIDLLTDHK